MNECVPPVKGGDFKLESHRRDSAGAKVDLTTVVTDSETPGSRSRIDDDNKVDQKKINGYSNGESQKVNHDYTRSGSSLFKGNFSTKSESECDENGHDVVKDLVTFINIKSPIIKHLIAIIACTLVLLLMTFAYLRIAMHALCPYDERLKTYIIMEKVEQCPVPILDYDDSCPFWKKCPQLAPEDLVRYVPAPAGKRHEMVCREIYNVLHLGAAFLHPSISYKRTMPSVKVHSPCPTFPPSSKKKGNMFMRLFQNIITHKNEGQSTEVAVRSDDGGFDWTLFVSTPLSLDLSLEQMSIAKQVIEKVKSNLISKYPDEALQSNWFERKVERVPFGGKYNWWHPSKDKWGDDKEDSGLRLVASYLKIMNWPKNLSTNFPFSELCDNGCPADFAISNTLEFREQYQPWKITPSAMHENRKGWVYVRGYSPTRYHPDPSVMGSSVLWMRPGLHKIEDPESFSRAVIHAVETCITDSLIRSGGKVAKCNILLDCDDVGLSKIPPIGPTKRTLKILQDHYPDKLGTFAISNLSSAAQMFLKVLLPLLPEIVRQKIHIVPNDVEERSKMLKAVIHEDFIPSQYGGKDDYKFHAKEYYQNGRYKAEVMADEEGTRYYSTIP
eukprot:CAMPEP_0176493282 /NCGR_PEP_ID=MMETSP0200_2-20121128/9468_1 /TAXON_ID=947934 /ORGANISM="Chaetoceros sp., Strain GSL56" /LENGTH=612 /DNA_ID=CAMNT_0017890939 /DNA_START=1355 /DNA_END=3190 /DNA_ORIENTATION=+